MTTIVARDGVIAADRRRSGYHLSSVNKTWAAPDGSIFADAGDAAWGEIFKEWYLDGQDRARREHLSKLMHDMDGDCVALQVRPDKKIVLWVVPFVPLEMHNTMYGIGSGSAYALGALSAGKTMEEAIRIASEWDECTSPDCDVIALPEPKRKRQKAKPARKGRAWRKALGDD